MTPPQRSDEELIELIRSENKADREIAAAYLTNHYTDIVQRMVARWNEGYPVEAGIVLDDSVMALIFAVRIGNYKPQESTLDQYFRGIAKNKIKNRVRQERNRKTQNNSYLFLWEKTKKNPKSTDHRILHNEFKNLMAEALKALDPKCRELLKRYWFKGERLKDIAEDLGITESTAKKRHERCRKKLKDILGKDPRQL